MSVLPENCRDCRFYDSHGNKLGKCTVEPVAIEKWASDNACSQGVLRTQAQDLHINS